MSNGIGYPIGASYGLPVGSWIQHRILTMVWDVGGRKHPRFRVVNSAHPQSTEDVKTYVKRVINDQVIDPLLSPTPWDIDLPDYEPSTTDNHPRIIVLQLDKTFEWVFTPGKPGIDAKQDKPHEDSDLHFVDALGDAKLATTAGAPADCRMLFWSVLERKKPDYGRGFNFYIDMIDPESRRRMPLIFDPNVPDSGGSSIP